MTTPKGIPHHARLAREPKWSTCSSVELQAMIECIGLDYVELVNFGGREVDC